MQAPRCQRIIMIGTAFETRGGIAAVINAYRAHGLFERWPIDYIATHCDGGALRKLLTAARALLALLLLVTRHRGAVLHVHSASRASFWRKSVFMAIGMLAQCPVIFHLHGGGFARFYQTECGATRRRIVRFFLDRAACIIVLSDRWQAWVRGITCNPRLVRLPNPVATVAERADTVRRNLILFLGRVERDKGVFDLLDAIPALRALLPDVRLVCAGAGDLESVARYAERLGIEEAVSLPGWVGPAEKQSLLERAAVLVLPSYAEGLPMSLLEAMAAGVPVVASGTGGIPDLVADGVNGFLCAPGDVAALERVLRRLMLDPELGRRIASAARESVRLRFAAEGVLAQLGEIYAEFGLRGVAGSPARMSAGPLREAA
jgi:glycosyltransferase involved in cell wall biosynthesis